MHAQFVDCDVIVTLDTPIYLPGVLGRTDSVTGRLVVASDTQIMIEVDSPDDSIQLIIERTRIVSVAELAEEEETDEDDVLFAGNERHGVDYSAFGRDTFSAPFSNGAVVAAGPLCTHDGVWTSTNVCRDCGAAMCPACKDIPLEDPEHAMCRDCADRSEEKDED